HWKIYFPERKTKISISFCCFYRVIRISVVCRRLLKIHIRFKMNVTATPLKDCFILESKVFYDERGYFMESFNEKTFCEKTGIQVHFVQDNQSVSTQGVLRGLHYQIGEFAQAKLVQVLQGEVLDVVVDIRPESETY